MPERQINLRVRQGGIRLDRFLADEAPALSRSAVQRLIDGGLVTVNGLPQRASYKVRSGDQVSARWIEAEAAGLLPEAIPLNVLYEDDVLLVVDKPAGMVVHPAPGHATGTLVQALLAHCPELASGGDDRLGIVHRLDRDTSGLILVAKSERVRLLLQRQFQERHVRKIYLALLHGHLKPAHGRIEAPVGRDPDRRQRMAVVAGGREAVTEYRVVEVLYPLGPGSESFSLVEAEPKTGRTHQIRVHLASIGHPIVGDPVYGRRRIPFDTPRQFLHAWRLGFQHPVSGQPMELEAPLAQDLAAILSRLQLGDPSGAVELSADWQAGI